MLSQTIALYSTNRPDSRLVVMYAEISLSFNRSRNFCVLVTINTKSQHECLIRETQGLTTAEGRQFECEQMIRRVYWLSSRAFLVIMSNDS